MRLMFKVNENNSQKLRDANLIVSICKKHGYNITDFVARIVWEDVSESIYNQLWKPLIVLDSDTISLDEKVIFDLVMDYSEVLVGFD